MRHLSLSVSTFARTCGDDVPRFRRSVGVCVCDRRER